MCIRGKTKKSTARRRQRNAAKATARTKRNRKKTIKANYNSRRRGF